MKQSIVCQLQAECLDQSVHASALLRKALVVASKLQLTDFRQWCDWELNGYKDMNSIPGYREIHGDIMYNHPRRGLESVLFPTARMKQILSDHKLARPISELESLIKVRDAKSVLQMSIPPGALQRYFADVLALGCIPKIIVNPAELAGIMDAVRTRILEWTLKLEEQGIQGEGLTFSSKEVEAAMTNPSINIRNFQGVLGDVSNSHVSQSLVMTVHKDDLDSLCSLLSEKGVEADDLEGLKKAVNIDPPPTVKGKFGPTVSSWIAGMMGKAATGAWDISFGVAGSLLADALKSFYGL